MSSSGNENSLPDIPPDSPGSSVSTRLQEEYEELLKYAVVMPKYNPATVGRTLTDVRESFAQSPPARETIITVTREKNADESGQESDVTPVVVRVSRNMEELPDFGGQSPISRDFEDLEDVQFKSLPKDFFATCLKEEMKSKERKFTEEKDSSSSVLSLPSVKAVTTDEYERVYSGVIDPDVGKMENLLDQWCLDLKRNVMAEFSQSKIRIVETGRQQLMKEQERHASEKTQLLNELDSLKELLHTYEQSIERKDQVISNLTNAMQKQREKFDMLKKFNEWKIRHNDIKREGFASNLARQFYRRKLSQKVWDAWHSVIENKWHQRVEKACQTKAQEVCMQLTNDYENKIASLNEALEAARHEVVRLHQERDHYEEAMKKAFMRGVCALNLEAMSMFQNGEDHLAEEGGQNGQEGISENLQSSLPDKDYGGPKSIPHEPFYSTKPGQAKIITTQGSRSTTTTTTVTQVRSQSTKSSGPGTRSKVLTAKVTAKVDHGRTGSGLGANPTLAPPMSSVIVERHNPILKQTIGHATAERYIKTAPESQAGIVHRKIAGQSGAINIAPNVQTIKIVE
ncbi:hypothetical protein ACJMK2_024570 [Sinanodonta woodiana]|uniref:Centrosomal protein POC5 n=1 Tax=Sinanodonta woodiana TaxID=1069815 RepID=A0ABD3XFL7_SINWO